HHTVVVKAVDVEVAVRAKQQAPGAVQPAAADWHKGCFGVSRRRQGCSGYLVVAEYGVTEPAADKQVCTGKRNEGGHRNPNQGRDERVGLQGALLPQSAPGCHWSAVHDALLVIIVGPQGIKASSRRAGQAPSDAGHDDHSTNSRGAFATTRRGKARSHFSTTRV